MLRLLVLLLILLNALYFAWSRNLLRPYGFAPVQQAEPFRLQQQIRPENVRILSANETGAADPSAQAANRPADCLQAGLFDESQAGVLRQVAQSVLPTDSWQIDPAVEPARWIVYLGRYTDAQTLAKKRAEVSALGVRVEPLANTSLEFGLSLGGFDTEARAKSELAALTQRGVRTAQVVQERPEGSGLLFRIPVIDDPIRARLDELKTALAGKPLRECK